MSKIVTITLLASTLLLAKPYTKADRILDMQIMAEAMGKIQTGFFYNNNDLVQEGALTLSDAIRKVQPPLEEEEEKDPMTRYMNNKVQMSNKIVKNIDRRAKIIIERFAEGDTRQALQAFSKVTQKCMECHTQLRNW
ncbi:MAG: cytochrome C [Campylobacterota bacterium]|nr:cytochrome C [Campylobacterota bacterium]